MHRRCFSCKKRFTELPYKCKFCGMYHCGGCRIPENHNCSGLRRGKHFFKNLKQVNTAPAQSEKATSLEDLTPIKTSILSRYGRRVLFLLFRKRRSYAAVSLWHIIGMLVLLAGSLVVFDLVLDYVPVLNQFIYVLPVGWLILVGSGIIALLAALFVASSTYRWVRQQSIFVQTAVIFGVALLIFGYGTDMDIGSLVSDALDSLKLSGSEIKSKSGLTPRAASEVEQYIFKFTNEERTKAGRKSLLWSDELASVARTHSEDMSERDFFDHVNPDGLNPSDRANKAGIYPGVGENIHTTSVLVTTACDSFAEENIAKCIVDDWMQSPGHRANILDQTYRQLGVGVYCDFSDCFSTQNFK